MFGSRLFVHLRKELREQWIVLLGVPTLCAGVALLVSLTVDTRELTGFPGVLLALAVIATAVVFGTDLFAGEIRRATGGFLGRSPRALSGSVLAKLVVFVLAIVGHGAMAWWLGYLALDDLARAVIEERSGGLRHIDAALYWPWLFAGFVFWLATMACIVRQAGVALPMALVPVGAWFGACTYGLRGVELSSGNLLPETWWWAPWAVLIAPAGLVVAYAMRLLREHDQRVWLVAAGVLIVPTTGVSKIVIDWQSFAPTEGAFQSYSLVSSDMRHALVTAKVKNSEGKTTYALVADLETGAFEQCGGPGSSWNPELRVYRSSMPVPGAMLLPAERWYDASGQLAEPMPRRAERQVAAFDVMRWPTAADGRLALTERDVSLVGADGGSRWSFPWCRGSGVPNLRYPFNNPFSWRCTQDGMLWTCLDVISGDAVPTEYTESDVRIGLVVGAGWIVGKRPVGPKFEAHPPKLIDRRSRVARPVPGLRPGEVIGLVLDAQHVAIGSGGHEYPRAWSTAVHSWLNVETGERGPLAWATEEEPRVVYQVVRGEEPRDMLLVTRANNGTQFEMVWDRGTASRVLVESWSPILAWDGGESALVQEERSIVRVHRDGRREVLFSLDGSSAKVDGGEGR